MPVPFLSLSGQSGLYTEPPGEILWHAARYVFLSKSIQFARLRRAEIFGQNHKVGSLKLHHIPPQSVVLEDNEFSWNLQKMGGITFVETNGPEI